MSIFGADGGPPAGNADPWGATPQRDVAGRFSVLVVCTGNICRSPAVEALLGRELADADGVTVSSAGTRALVGRPMAEPMAALLASAGVPDEDFTARALTERLVAAADLVLVLSRGHRADVVELWPPAVRRTFTLRELARLVADVDPGEIPPGPPAGRLTALVPLAIARRGQTPATAEDDDVVDPYGGGPEVYQLSFDQLRPAVETIAAVALG